MRGCHDSRIPGYQGRAKGKKGLIVGIANDQSIAWGCAKAFRALGADLAVTYLNERAKSTSSRSHRHGGADLHADGCHGRGPDGAGVRTDREGMGQLDFLLHSIAFSPKEALHGRVVDVGRDGFLKTMMSRAGRSCGWPIWPSR